MSLALSDPDDRPNEIGQVLDDASQEIADRIDELLSSLSALGAFRVHRAWECSIERDMAAKAAAEAAIRAVLANGWVDVPLEVSALYAPEAN